MTLVDARLELFLKQRNAAPRPRFDDSAHRQVRQPERSPYKSQDAAKPILPSARNVGGACAPRRSGVAKRCKSAPAAVGCGHLINFAIMENKCGQSSAFSGRTLRDYVNRRFNTSSAGYEKRAELFPGSPFNAIPQVRAKPDSAEERYQAEVKLLQSQCPFSVPFFRIAR
jgi:hypothetical protein